MLKITFRTLLISTLLVLGGAAFQTDSASAQQVGSNFVANRIIDDAVFYNGNQMTASEIQQFLNARIPVCDTNGTQMHWTGQTRAQYGASVGNPAPYTCLKDYIASSTPAKSDSGLCAAMPAKSNRSAAQIIDDVARACNISQKALIVTLQKEQSLITDDWPWPVQYEKAMGYYCPDDPNRPGWCAPEYAGFFNQVYNAARQFQRYRQSPDSFNHAIGRTSYIAYQANAPSCGGTNLNMQSAATAGLYNYTPYQPNTAALNNLYGTGDSCSAYGNRNFWRMFNDWFGTTFAFTVGGIDYSTVFNPEYYLAQNPDLAVVYGTNYLAAFNHFVQFGMAEGRSATSDFNAMSYLRRYADVRRTFNGNIQLTTRHYILYGKSEGRIGTGDYLGGTTVYNGINYASVYNFDYYAKNNSDILKSFGLNDYGALQHFVISGMAEGRSATSDFNAMSYLRRYADVRRTFNGNIQLTTRHYILYGKSEGRIGTGDYLGGTTVYNGINYASVYNFDYYAKNNSDILKSFGLNDYAALQHFVTSGMAEGRSASSEFNVITYKTLNADLALIYGNNLRSYYLHFIYYGKAEGRTAI